MWHHLTARSWTTGPVSPWRVSVAELLRRWWPDVAVGLVVLAFGVLTIRVWDPLGPRPEGLAYALVTLGMAVACSLFRIAPGVALGLVWLTSMFQVIGLLDISPVQLSVVIVAYGTGRYGSVVTLWASGLSIPLGAVAALGYLRLAPTDGLASRLVRVLRVGSGHRPMTILIGLAVGFVLAVAVLGMAWTLGLALRLRGRAERLTEQRLAAEADRHQAEEIARLREEQTRLARDVHDVVGHSLAVILAQAESAQFRPDSDTAAVRASLEHIAESARQSLRDVRQVLSSTDDTNAVTAGPAVSLDALVSGVQTAGHDVHSTVVGRPRPLPPELDVVAFHVLQEMLTNALKHGRRTYPVVVERHWQGELRIEVVNVVGTESAAGAASADDTAPIATGTTGRGLEGMRRRLESVGGRLDLRRRDDPVAGTTFTATAWVPFRSGRG